MSYEKCIEEITKAAGKLSEAQLEEVAEKVSKLVKKLDVEGRAEAFDEALLKEIEAETEFAKAAAVIERRNAIKNKLARITQYQRLKNGWADDPAEGLLAATGGSMTGRTGSKNATTFHQEALSESYVGALTADLERANLRKLAAKGTLDDQIWKAMGYLNTKTPDTAALGKLQPEAVEIGKILLAHKARARINANKAGAWIKELDGYITQRSHDRWKIRPAMEDGTWIRDVSDWLDWNRSLDDVPVEERGRVLSEMGTDFASGVHLKFREGGVAGFKGFANVGKRMSHERVLHFKSPEAEFAYNQKYGSGTLMESVIYGLDHLARDTALMRDWGPNAKANYDAVVADIQRDLKKAGDIKNQEKFDAKARNLEKILWPHLTGEINIAENAVFARRSGAIRNVETGLDLVGAVLSQPTDLAFSGAAARHQGVSMLRGVGEALSFLFKDVSTAERAKVISELGVMVDSMASSLKSRWNPDRGVPGASSKFVDTVFKWNLMRAWTDRERGGFVMMTSHRLANYADKSLVDMPMRNLLKQYNIEAAEWDIIRQSPERHVDGKTFITPEGIAELPDSAFVKYVEGQGKTPSAYQIDRVRTELQDRLRAFFQDQATTAVPEPNTMTRATLLRGMKPGDVYGEANRHFWMYKGFTAGVMRQVLGREVHGYSDVKVSSARAVFNMLKDPTGSSFVGVANIVAWSTVLGYVAMSLKDMAKGKEPRVPEDAEGFRKLLFAAMAQGGGMGIYGDFLFGEMKSRLGQGPLETLLGPTWRRLSTLAVWYDHFKNGDEFAAKAVIDVYNHAPFVNLFYTKWAMDYLFLYRLQEWANPGYLRRMEQRLKDDKDQEFIFPPSQAIPYGGGL